MGLLYTVGHSRFEFEYFANLLKKFEINYLIDVRSTPDQIILICTVRKDIWTLKRLLIQIYLSKAWKV